MQGASCTYRIALGPRAGQKMLSLQTISRRGEGATPALCANLRGFSPHAALRCGAHQRKELERLSRYITRPAIANERLQRHSAGQVVLQLKSVTGTAPRISSCRRWNSCNGLPLWCRVRAYI